MRDPREVFPVRRVERDPHRDFWAMIRWGLVLGAALWVLIEALAAVVVL